MSTLHTRKLSRNSPSSDIPDRPQPPAIIAELGFSDWCAAQGVVATGYTPVLSLCRELLQAGIDPDRALHVYRRGILSIRIRSISEAAKLTVKSAGNGTPIFALDGGRQGAAGPPMRARPDSGLGEGEWL